MATFDASTREPSVQSARSLAWAARADPRRSLVLMGVGAIVGLAIAGFGLFTAKGTAVRTLPPEDLALVNQRPILRSDFIAQTESAYGRPFAETTRAERERVIQDMLREELFVQRGLDLDLAASDPDVRQALVNGVERQVEADVTAGRPSDDDLRRFFAQHRDTYASEGRMVVHDLASARDRSTKAGEAAEALRGGASLADVAARYGFIDTKKTDGEEFYFAARIHLGERLFAVARSLADHAVGGPIVEGETTHLLAMERNAPPTLQTFEEARDRLTQDYRKAAQARVEAADEKYLRSKAEVRIAPEYR